MAEAVKKTRDVERTIIEKEEAIVLTLSPEEARTIYDVLYLTEAKDVRTCTAKHIGSALTALGATLDWPTHNLRVDFANVRNDEHTVYLFERQ